MENNIRYDGKDIQWDRWKHIMCDNCTYIIIYILYSIYNGITPGQNIQWSTYNVPPKSGCFLHRLEQAKPRFVPKLGVASGSTDCQKGGNVGNVKVQDSSMVSF